MDGTWKVGPEMVNYKMSTAITPSPFGNRPQDFFVTGGYGGQGPYSGTEILSENGWRSFSPSLPVTVYFHCMVLLNSTAAIVIGGIQNGDVSANTFIISNGNRVEFFDNNHTKTKLNVVFLLFV